VKFVLQQLSHYKFKQHLFSKTNEYGCLCIEVTEEYTRQLCATCGKLDKAYVNRVKNVSTVNKKSIDMSMDHEIYY